MTTRAIVLFSGGLDSILACAILAGQGLDVLAVMFTSPFFGVQCVERAEDEKRRMLERYGIRLKILDITEDFLPVLLAPAYGYGRFLNPCVDCRILMLRKAAWLLEAEGASFVATGEVMGQRRLTQRREVLALVERESGLEGRLLRPLSALKLAPTPMEKAGTVDRSRLFAIHGRGRKEQMALASHLGIRHYPAPSGGCLLADAHISGKVRGVLDRWPDLDTHDLRLSPIGIHTFLPDGSWLVIGRNQRENDRIRALAREDDCIVSIAGGSGPCGLWKRMKDPGLCASVASIVASRKGGSPGPTTVLFSGRISCAVPVLGCHTVSSGTMVAHNSMQRDLHHA
ncbi:MAG: hypothetical protein K6360_01250 [Deltaproteobacteria bacterium]